ncbi:MAG: sensor histidine kinase [Burkholderiaceae bacterium]
MGIDQRELGRIFERHYRVDGKAGGRGIGLHIVERICARFGWRIDVSSTPSEGSVFVISFDGRGRTPAPIPQARGTPPA